MVRILQSIVALIIVTATAFTQGTQHSFPRVMTNSITGYPDSNVTIKDTLRVNKFIKGDSTAVPSTPSYGTGNLIFRGNSGIFYQRPDGTVVNLDSAGTSSDSARIAYFAQYTDSTRYLTTYDAQTSGQSSIHWNNLTNKPTVWDTARASWKADTLTGDIVMAQVTGVQDSINARLRIVDRFRWHESGQATKNDSLRFIEGANITLTQANNTLTIAASGGSGDMTKAVYDTDNNGVVEYANEAAAIGATPTPNQLYAMDAGGTMGFYPWGAMKAFWHNDDGSAGSALISTDVVVVTVMVEVSNPPANSTITLTYDGVDVKSGGRLGGTGLFDILATLTAVFRVGDFGADGAAISIYHSTGATLSNTAYEIQVFTGP